MPFEANFRSPNTAKYRSIKHGFCQTLSNHDSADYDRKRAMQSKLEFSRPINGMLRPASGVIIVT